MKYEDVIKIEKSKDYNFAYDVKIATRIMKGAPGRPYRVGSEDVKKINELYKLTQKGDKESEYLLNQLDREINEALVKNCLDSLTKINFCKRLETIIGVNKKPFLRRKFEKIFENYSVRTIKGAIERAIKCKDNMEKLASELGKNEVFESDINLEELLKQFR